MRMLKNIIKGASENPPFYLGFYGLVFCTFQAFNYAIDYRDAIIEFGNIEKSPDLVEVCRLESELNYLEQDYLNAPHHILKDNVNNRIKMAESKRDSLMVLPGIREKYPSFVKTRNDVINKINKSHKKFGRYYDAGNILMIFFCLGIFRRMISNSLKHLK